MAIILYVVDEKFKALHIFKNLLKNALMSIGASQFKSGLWECWA